jgi:excisionase family DNA binding protein
MDDGGLTVDQAAAALHVSARTVHRRIKHGQLQAHKTQTPRGAVWCVHLDGAAVMDDSTPAPVSMTQDTRAVMDDSMATPAGVPELGRALELVDRLQRENVQLAGQVGYLQAKLQDAQEQIRMLTMETDEPTPATVDEARPRPWWQIWRR